MLQHGTIGTVKVKNAGIVPEVRPDGRTFLNGKERRQRCCRTGNMKKSLYSLMLSEDVVREVDVAAHKLGTSRSNLINQILADYVNLTTPERRINDVFTALEQMMSPSRDIVPFFSPNTFTMSLKSSLAYKYRPTVKYEVELYRDAEDSIGELSVIFRTQSASLIQSMTDFFRIWKHVEDRQLAPLLRGEPIHYALYDGKFVRSIALPSEPCTTEELAQVLSDYITTFDSLMKAYLTGSVDAGDIEQGYYQQMSSQKVLI